MQNTTRTPTEALRIVVEHWPHLRALIDTATPDVWPPANPSLYLRALDEHDAAEAAAGHLSPAEYLARPGHDQDEAPAAGHEHLVLAEQPAPLRLHVVDASRAVEAALCSLADEIAAQVQRRQISAPTRPNPNDSTGRDLALLAVRDEADPQRWHYNLRERTAPRAAKWLLARIEGEPGPCESLTLAHRRLIGRVAREAARRIERTIGAEHRSVPMGEQPCPWCAGQLVMHRGADDDAAAVTCETGAACCAPTSLDGEGRRVWRGAEALLALHEAVAAAARRRRRRDQKRAERSRRAAA
ncbi:hypothetical protein ABT390_36705 [Streptomyces aurantiacus]|uniref:Uncharacterized protein n=1 Tax=Streptomyces aurantiacus JA 4570 TaxID=1286094 RepID=S3ZR49_9ACTN|nr:hypothetical protein [Streptomyces aurantiacus]EPH40875.1 hypothetical protein STRAU_6090 [Streptomyces aurantiacus JA 4570]